MKIHHRGFTLIELSIVLIIIGLVLGGVLFGKDLIRAAELRSLASEKDKYIILTKTFQEKYGALPGDMPITAAAQFEFFTFTGSLAGSSGFGDNNGLIFGHPETFCDIECGAFWRHLSDAGLIARLEATLEANSDAGYTGVPSGEMDLTPFSSHLYMPAAKTGGVFWGAGSLVNSYMGNISGINTYQNFFWVAPAAKTARQSFTEPSLSAVDAFAIDSKIDDGKPNSGKFIASTIDNFTANFYWSATVNASSRACTYGGSGTNLARDVQYNLNLGTGGNKITCLPLFLW